MAEFWDELSGYSRTLFVVGSVFTVFMLFKLLFMFFGNDGSDTNGDGIDGDGEGAFDLFGLKLLTLRTFSALVAIGSWSIFVCNMAGLEEWLSTLIGVGVGIVAAVLVAAMYAGISRLQNSGNLNLDYAVGKNAEVYLTIPAGKSGVGKVSVFMEDRYAEVDAMTDSESNLKTGTRIRVVKVLGENLLLVEKLV